MKRISLVDFIIITGVLIALIVGVCTAKKFRQTADKQIEATSQITFQVFLRGVTVTGGEPLMQIDFVIELFTELKKRNIHTAIDTSGIIYNKDNPNIISKLEKLLSVTDLVLLDIKHINNDEHIKLTGKPNSNILEFAKYLSDNNHKMWIRHVLVPGITLNDEYLTQTREFIESLHNVEKIEVLPYHTMGTVKYEQLGMKYPLEGVNAPTKDEVRRAKYMLGVIKDVA